MNKFFKIKKNVQVVRWHKFENGKINPNSSYAILPKPINDIFLHVEDCEFTNPAGYIETGSILMKPEGDLIFVGNIELIESFKEIS